MRIVSPMRARKIIVRYVMIDDLYIEEYGYPTLLIIFDMSGFNIILGMDWLIQYNT